MGKINLYGPNFHCKALENIAEEVIVNCLEKLHFVQELQASEKNTQFIALMLMKVKQYQKYSKSNEILSGKIYDTLVEHRKIYIYI